MAKAKMEFKRGSGLTHTISLPADSWSAGGTLYFAAKVQPDDDATDTQAVIDKGFTDSVVTDVTIGGIDYKKYTLSFSPEDMDDISFSDGSKFKKYLGEFKFVPASGDPEIFPADDNFIEVIVYANVKVGGA